MKWWACFYAFVRWIPKNLWSYFHCLTTRRKSWRKKILVLAPRNGNPLQCSCLENPRDGAAWWATVYGVAQSQTRLKWLSNSSSSIWFLPFSFWLTLLSMILGPSMLLQMTLFHSFFYSLIYILRNWGQAEKGTTENEMAGWHHWLDGHEFEWTLGVDDGQGGLACCDSWGRKELDTTEQLNWTDNYETLYNARSCHFEDSIKSNDS